MDKGITELIHLVKTVRYIPDDIRFFYITNTLIVRCVSGTWSIHSQAKEFGFIQRLSPTSQENRGHILEIFAMLEELINEFLHLRFFGFDHHHAQEFDDLLDFLSFEHRVRLLAKWGIINSSLAKRIQDITSVRNQFAHVWDIHSVKYTKASLTQPEIFEKFKQHFVSVFQQLIEKHQEQQTALNFEDHIEQLIRVIKENANQ